MVEKTMNPFSFHKQNHVFVKFAVSCLLLGLAFRIYVSDSIKISSVVVEEVQVDHTLPSPPPPLSGPSPPADNNVVSFDFPTSQTPLDFPEKIDNKTSVEAKCDIFIGDWVPDPSGSMYTNETCHAIENHQNCMKNGRPDSGYLYWRWKPRDCELPRFDPKKFLDFVRNKSWAFIGDSISRNHVQSLICILSQVEQGIEVYHDEEYRSKRWHFPSHNFTLSVIWTPFLVKSVVFEDNDGVATSATELHLDKLDTKWTNQYPNFDYVIISGGKWFLKAAIYHENDTVLGCHYCPGKNLTELGFDYAYRKALNLVLNFIARSDHKTYAFLRTTTPDHFEGGEWFSGGTCNRTVPYKDGDVDMNDVDNLMRRVELEEFDKVVRVESENLLKLLDTTRMTLLRPDGHPGAYRQFYPFAEDENAKVQTDCLHWCLPGPIDSWNDLVMEMLMNAK